jgi:hypothetical protein
VVERRYDQIEGVANPSALSTALYAGFDEVLRFGPKQSRLLTQNREGCPFCDNPDIAPEIWFCGHRYAFRIPVQTVAEDGQRIPTCRVAHSTEPEFALRPTSGYEPDSRPCLASTRDESKPDQIRSKNRLSARRCRRSKNPPYRFSNLRNVPTSDCRRTDSPVHGRTGDSGSNAARHDRVKASARN